MELWKTPLTTEDPLDNGRKTLAEVERSLADSVRSQATQNLTISNLNLEAAENVHRFIQIGDSLNKIGESLQSLERIARANTEAITVLREAWHAYLTARPK